MVNLPRLSGGHGTSGKTHHFRLFGATVKASVTTSTARHGR